MYKTDKASLEALSLALDPRDLANLGAVLTYIQQHDLASVPPEEVERLVGGLREIERLRSEGRVYGFHVQDTYADPGDDEGVELHLRHGDTLRPYVRPGGRYFMYTAPYVAHHIKINSLPVSVIYTGDIPLGGEFLGLPQECDPYHPIYLSALEPEEISIFRRAGIDVVMLDV
ncbi:hypothetical protein COV94_04265, partial [Candidatus Woesearchaeota archaeon CG11_big_fil_rev_8_21_14_0_20_57_5]